jgi:DNA-binding NarL/FixJ family response regulator
VTGTYQPKVYRCHTCQRTIPPHEVLGREEYAVLLDLARGARPGDIARARHRSVKTVSTHINRIRAKLGVPTRELLVVYAWERNLLKREPEHGCVHHQGTRRVKSHEN